MADLKISQLTAITTLTPATDVLPVVDVTGTTKKITTNQILGSGGTATLASATISGDLTVDTSTLKVDSANNRVGIGTAIPAVGFDVGYTESVFGSSTSSGYSILNLIGTGTGSARYGSIRKNYDSPFDLRIRASNSNSDAPIIFELSNASTAMTLNSTGLGVGQSPTANLDIQGNPSAAANNTITGALTRMRDIYTRFRSNSAGISGDLYAAQLFSGGNAAFEIYSMTSYPLVFGTAAAERMRIDSSGRLLVGSTSAFTDLTGSKEVKIGDSGMQTFSSAITAATPTNIARGGVGGLVYVGGYNGTGQYGAVVLWTSASATVVSVINGTGSTITFGVSAGFLQITSSLALTQVTASCIRI